MAVIKCKMCGGDVEPVPGKSWGKCTSCDSTVTLPKDSSDRRINLLNRADAFRRQNEFDKAISAYEKILEEDQTDAEAHWGIALSRFGIEYVENPLTLERKPTLHRLQTTSILADDDYKAAVENAQDEDTRKLYEEQAEEIAEIQKKAIEQSEREEQYDIFISYKESDENGERTRDSVYAFEVYNALQREGYNVFYAKESLKGRLGDEYEPIIFSALRSSQVMILIGTKKEYFEAEWVRNEWSRYLDLMRQEKDKPADEQLPRQLIPCYRDMDAYELPVELNMLQSMNMNSLDFLPVLVSGVKTIMEGGSRESYVGKNDEVSRKLQRAMNQAELGDFPRADKLAEEVLENDPNNATAQMVKLLVQLKVNTPDELVKQKQPLTHNRLYIMACRNAKGAQKKRYESYNKKIITNLETAEKQKNLDKVLEEIKQLEEKEKSLSPDSDASFRQLSKSYIEQAEALEKMGGFGNSEEQAKACRKRAEEIEHEIKVREDERRRRLEEEIAKKKAVEDQLRREREEREAAERAEKLAKEKAELERQAQLRRKKARKRLAVFLLIILIAAAITAYKMFFEDRFAYDAAVKSIESSETDSQLTYAESILNRLGDDYQDVAKRRAQIAADRMFIHQDQRQAYDAYQQLDADYRTAPKYAWYQQQYDAALSLIRQGQYDDAISALREISYYGDAADQILHAHLLKGDAAFAAKQYLNALQSYQAAQGYEDAESRIAQTEAAMLFEAQQYAEAYTAYKQLDPQYFTAEHKKKFDEWYDNAKALLESGDYENAIRRFEELSYYDEEGRNSKEQLQNAHYTYGMRLLGQQQIDAAREQYAAAGDYRDSQTLLTQIDADTLYRLGAYEEAYQLYAKLDPAYQTEKDTYRGWYEEANDLLVNQGKVKEAIDRFERIQYMDSETYPVKEKLTFAYAAYADSLLKQADGAVDIDKVKAAQKYYDLAGQDGTAIIQQYYYQTGIQAIENQAHLPNEQAAQNAKSAFEVVAGYQDADEYLARLEAFDAAQRLLKQQNLIEARNAFLQVGDYLDAKQSAETCGEIAYQEAQKLGMTDKLAVYAQLGDYGDCKQQIREVETRYNQASIAYASKNYTKAAGLYAELGDYQDAEEMVEQCRLAQARSLIQEGKYPEGIEMLGAVRSDLLDENEIQKAWQAYAGALAEQGNTYRALALYASLDPATKSDDAYQQLLKKAADDLSNDSRAQTVYQSLVSDPETDEAIRYQFALAARLAGRTEAALTAFRELGEYQDSADMYSELAYQQGELLYNRQQYKEAIPYLQAAGSARENADTMLKYSMYSYARDLFIDRQYQEALEIYESLGDYAGSRNYAEQCRQRLSEAGN